MDVKIFRPKILQILETADLDTVSAKKVRKQLQTDSGLDLSEYKLDKYIGEVFNAFTSSGTPKTTPTSTVKTIPKPKSEPREPQIDAPSSAPATKKRKIKSEAKVENVSDLEDADERYARELQAALNQTRSSRSGGAKAAKKVKRKRKMETIINSDGETVEVEAKKKKRAPTNNGFNKLLTLTAELSDLVGHKYLSRPQVSKHVWAYIKQHGLQDPGDKRYINCDDKLRSLFGTPRVHMFTMTKLMQPLMLDDGTAPAGVGLIKPDAVLSDVDDEEDVGEVDVKAEVKPEANGLTLSKGTEVVTAKGPGLNGDDAPDAKRNPAPSSSEESDW